MQNVEFKAELRDPELARLICRRLGAAHAETVRQRDTYFRVTDGRLKRREAEGEDAEYIYYHRPDRSRPRLSHFTILTEQQAMSRYGNRELPVWLVVEKTREIWMHRHIRIHFDEVDHLGRFMEAEALVTRRQHVGRCQRRVAKLRERLAPALGELIATSYADMLAQELDADRPLAAG